MTGLEIAAQILNCIGSAINMVGINIKDKKKILLFFIVGNILTAVATGLLAAWVGMLILIVFVVETIINYFWDKKYDKYPVWLILIYVIVPCVLSAITFQSAWDLLPIAAGILFPLALLSRDFKLRLLNLLSVSVWIPYNLHIGQYVGAVSCAVFVVINLVAIIRLDVLKPKSSSH
ncbi:YgjV family protein [Candidatus Saccharibacteria bacterium]|nr:YgjV family protein [Candidatus Saccharibacteria bacterium]